jgi:hypothetical protein
MLRPTARLLAVPVLVLTLVVQWAAHAPGAGAESGDGRPSITVLSGSSMVGGTVRVHLDGWPREVVDVAVCGRGAVQPSFDCDRPGTRTVLPLEDGTAYAELRVVDVGSCPCVVRASTATNAVVATAQVSVPDLPRLAADDPSLATPTDSVALVAHADLVTPSGLKARLGLERTRELRVTVRNEASFPIAEVTLSAAVGDDRSGSILTLPTVTDLAPGEERTVTTPIELPLPPIGRFSVHGTASGSARVATFSASTSNAPFIPFVLFLTVLAVWLRVRVANRRAARSEARAARGQAETDAEANIGQRSPRSPDQPRSLPVPSAVGTDAVVLKESSS